MLFIHVHQEGLLQWRLSLLLLYVCIALSDVFDGRLARKAGAPSHVWGQVDAAADIAFTSLSLATAAWLGHVGPWVPVGVAVLGGRFLLRNQGLQPTRRGRLLEDRGGKAAGVIYYLLVGAVALELAVEGNGGRWWVARAGDVVFLYTLFLLLRRRLKRPSLSAR
jgi:phosphatidylglycerophosphate synthase